MMGDVSVRYRGEWVGVSVSMRHRGVNRVVIGV